MLKGLQYYSDDPGKVGQTFIRLERDFDLHIHFRHNLPHVLELAAQKPIQDFLQVCKRSRYDLCKIWKGNASLN